MTHRAIDFADLPRGDAYRVLTGTVVPRPIAWVTTLSPDGVINAAPYSFFNCLSHDPPILALGLEMKAHRVYKDTTANIAATGAFVVNIVDHARAAAMATTAAGFAPDVDELAMAGLTAVPGTKVACPRIAEAPVSFECRRSIGIAMGDSREIVLGEILMAHVRDDILDATYHTDPSKLDAIARMGGPTYATTRDRFDLRTPDASEF